MTTFHSEQAHARGRPSNRRRWLLLAGLLVAVAVAVALILLYTGGGSGGGGGGGY